jgi:hypothetical protein
MIGTNQCIIGVFGIIAATGLQIYAWKEGKNGKVQMTTASILSAIVGVTFGVSI